MQDDQESESTVIAKEPCPDCGSTDNLRRYSDGHAFCFTPTCKRWEPPTDGSGTQRTVSSVPSSFNALTGEPKAITGRRLTAETCAKWKYWVGNDGEQSCHIANFYHEGVCVGQKIRYPNKGFKALGKVTNHLYGQHLWGEKGKMVVITEGELDAMSVSQVQDHKWPVVSLPLGGNSAKKAIAAQSSWLQKFDFVILMFDEDDAGRAAVKEAMEVLPAGRVKVASLPLKDASDMLKAGRGGEIVRAIWDAKVYRPDGLVTAAEMKERAKQPVVRGFPWAWPSLEDMTYGRRKGELYGLGAGTGIGKTDFLTQQIAFDIDNGYSPVVFFLEQDPIETLERIAGKRDGRSYHVPGEAWTDKEREAGIDAIPDSLILYDSWGANDWDVVREKIRYMAVAEGREIFYLDHLTALADTSNERESLEHLMKELATLVKSLNIVMIYVSHLATPEGKSHEEGGRVMIKHFKGSRSIGFWTHYMFGMERDTQSEEAAQETLFRCLKDRKTGRATGKTFWMKYESKSSRLLECEKSDPFADDGDTNDKGAF